MNTTKRCAQCGAAFMCGRMAATCWCSNLPPLPRSALASGADCLCLACLEARLEATATPPGEAGDDTKTDPDPAS